MITIAVPSTCSCMFNSCFFCFVFLFFFVLFSLVWSFIDALKMDRSQDWQLSPAPRSSELHTAPSLLHRLWLQHDVIITRWQSLYLGYLGKSSGFVTVTPTGKHVEKIGFNWPNHVFPILFRMRLKLNVGLCAREIKCKAQICQMAQSH